MDRPLHCRGQPRATGRLPGGARGIRGIAQRSRAGGGASEGVVRDLGTRAMIVCVYLPRFELVTAAGGPETLTDLLGSRQAHRMKLLITMLGVCLGLLGPVAAMAAPTTIAVLHGPSAVEAYGSVTAWSDYDAAAQSWHVVISRDGAISVPPIPTAKSAIEVDVGPGPSG